ncbi:MAG: hypothetical protein NUW09_05410 [Deltaproteobacteria bacterium]|nr:hypothetical protein [Deltaproteobacteria bacterium]
MKKGITVIHKKYGRGRLVSFDPFVEMVIVFNGNGRKGRMKNVRRSFASSYMDDVSVDGVPIRSLVDYGDSRWYPVWTLKRPE